MPTFWIVLIAAAVLAGYILAFAAACHALLHKRDPQAALGWVAFIFLVPFIGTLAYLLIGVSRVDSQAARLLSRAALGQAKADSILAREVMDALPPDPSGEKSPDAYVVSRVGRTLTGRPTVGGNHIELLCNGEEAYPRMLEAIGAATRNVYLSTYIFKGGKSGHAFAEALAAAAGRGLDVRLIVDGLGGSMYSLDKPWKSLARQGVKVCRFLPSGLFPPRFSLNLRTHRKVLVCDGVTGFTGGMNIGDHHLVTDPGNPHPVQDIHFCCRGPIAVLLQEAFLMDWAFVSQPTPSPEIRPEPCGDSRCRLVFDALGRGRENIHDLLCGVIGGARRRVSIITPYFLPPRELANALTSAALRGVEVRLILPAENNLPYVHRASLHMQPDLVRKGVHIYFQAPPFAHTKLLLVDDYYCLAGSANLDPRSLFLNFELNLEIFDPAFHARMQAYFERVLARSVEAGLSFYTRRMLPEKLLNAAFWLFSPYL